MPAPPVLPTRPPASGSKPGNRKHKNALRGELALSLYFLLGFVALCAALFLTPVSRLVFDDADMQNGDAGAGPYSLMSHLKSSFGIFTLPRTKASLGDGSGHIILQVTLRYHRYALWEISGQEATDTRLQNNFMSKHQQHMQGIVVNQLGYHTLKTLSTPTGLELLTTDLESSINGLFRNEEFIENVFLKDLLLYPLPLSYDPHHKLVPPNSLIRLAFVPMMRQNFLAGRG